MDESASETPPLRSTSFFFLRDNQLFSLYFPISFPPFFLSSSPSVSPGVFLILTFLLSFLPSFSLLFLSLFHHMGDYISWNSGRKRGEIRECLAARKLAENPALTSILSSLLTLSFAVFAREKTSKSRGRGRGLVAWWTSEDISKYSNISPAWKCARACGMTENQSRERHDGIFLLQSVTLFRPNWLDVP